jgi:hypothetical protein
LEEDFRGRAAFALEDVAVRVGALMPHLVFFAHGVEAGEDGGFQFCAGVRHLVCPFSHGGTLCAARVIN